MTHLMISAAHKSSGKTTVTMGLCAALKNQGLLVQAFKKGPDYIDPMWLRLATGRDCHNLDFHSMRKDEIRGTFRQFSHNADISLIEGNKGLFDGLDVEGRNSNAALARWLKAPVILVIDAQGMTRGIAPLILGYQAFDKRVNIAGVILNKLGGKRHEGKLRAVIEHYTDVPVIGAIHKHEALMIKEQHLGLIPGQESLATQKQIQQIADLVADQVDLKALVNIASTAPAINMGRYLSGVSYTPKTVRIAVAKDKAFGFYYPGDLQALQAAGAEIITIDTLKDKQLPDIDGLFIGGGFPESHMPALSANISMRKSIANAIEAGLPVYAECGGLMYLTRSIRWQNETWPMVGALPADAEMCQRPQGRGYVRLQETENFQWPGLKSERYNSKSPSGEFCAHEFHYSRLINLPKDQKYAYKVLRGTGITGKNDGLLYKNVLASYAHLREVSHRRWASRFVQFIKQQKQRKLFTDSRDILRQNYSRSATYS